MPRYARVSRFVCVRWFFNQQRTRRLGSQTPSNRNPWPSSFSSFARTFYGISGIGWWDGNESHPLTIWRAENFVWPVVTRLLYIFAFPFNPAVATEGCEKRLLSNRPHSFVFFFSKAILDLARYMPLFSLLFFSSYLRDDAERRKQKKNDKLDNNAIMRLRLCSFRAPAQPELKNFTI